MRNWKVLHRLRIAALIAVLTLAAAACGGEQADEPEDGAAASPGADGGEQAAEIDCEEPVKIGVISPMSGQYATWGEGWTNAAKLAIEDWNSNGGVLGCEVEALYEDAQGDPTEGVNAANKLVAEGVVGVAGPIFSGVTLAAGPIFDEAGIPFLTGSSNIDITEQGWESVFRIAFREDQSGPFDASIAQAQGWKTGVVVHDNTAFAKGLAEQFTNAFDGETTTEVITPGESDYSATLTKIKEQNPEFIYYSGYYAEGGQLVRQGKELGLQDVGWLFGNSNQDPEFIEIAGDAAEGILMGTWPPPTAMAEENEEAAAYVEAYEEAYGETPSSLYHWAYDGVNVVLEALEQAGSRNVDDVRTAIDEGEFLGTSGEMVFDEKGDREQQPLGVLTVEDGEFVPADVEVEP